MSKLATRLCPQCGKVKPFRLDQITCGCPKPPVEKVTDRTYKSGKARVINVDATRICNEEQLIEALQIDLTKWYVDDFMVRKWEMGYVSSMSATTKKIGKGKSAKTVTSKGYTPGHHQLFAVSAKLKRVITVEQNDDYVKDNVRLMRENKRLTVLTRTEKKYRDRLLETNVSADDMIVQIREIAQRLGDFKVEYPSIVPPPPAFKDAVSSTHTEDATLLISDTHFGDVIRQGDTSGFPEFDLPIAGNRFGYTMEKVRQILSIQRAAYPIKTLRIWFGGDMGNGELHDAPVSNALFLGPQIDFTFKMLKMGIDELLTLAIPDPVTGVRVVEEIVLLFTCGNHMRESTAKYMPLKYQAQRTFDWLIYQLLIEWYRETPRVKIRQSMSPYIFEDIRGHRYGFAHGMQVGYKNSPDAQCKSMDTFLKTIRSLFDSPEFRRKNGLAGATFSRMCIGDIHVPVSFPRLISNGSLNGQNELGVNWGLEPIPCVQQLFGVTEKHLQTFHYEVNSTHVQREASDWNGYGRFAAEYEREHGRK